MRLFDMNANVPTHNDVNLMIKKVESLTQGMISQSGTIRQLKLQVVELEERLQKIENMLTSEVPVVAIKEVDLEDSKPSKLKNTKLQKDSK